jgi:hypothetical protein
VTMSEQTVWLYGVAGSNYHDQACKCGHHCQNCHENLLTAAYPNPATRYCSDHCKGQAKRGRARGRALSAGYH